MKSSAYSKYPNFPLLKSLKASINSCFVFITKGPCAAIGSFKGSPLNTKTTASSVASISKCSPAFSSNAKWSVGTFSDPFTVMLPYITRSVVLNAAGKLKSVFAPAFNLALSICIGENVLAVPFTVL